MITSRSADGLSTNREALLFILANSSNIFNNKFVTFLQILSPSIIPTGTGNFSQLPLLQNHCVALGTGSFVPSGKDNENPEE